MWNRQMDGDWHRAAIAVHFVRSRISPLYLYGRRLITAVAAKPMLNNFRSLFVRLPVSLVPFVLRNQHRGV